jgi:hypothetical protein
MLRANVFHELHPMVGVRWALDAKEHVSSRSRKEIRVLILVFVCQLEFYDEAKVKVFFRYGEVQDVKEVKPR